MSFGNLILRPTMDWILDHLQLVIFLAVAIAGAMQKVRSQSGGHPGEAPSSADDAGLAERTRHLQEDIRRKIAERRGGSRPAPPAQPPPRLRPIPAPIERRQMPRTVFFPSAPVAVPPVMEPSAALTSAEEAMLARQRELAEKMAQLKAGAEARKAERQVERAGGRAPAQASNSLRGMILADLRDPAGTRRALLLREILGEPVGLR